MLLKIIIVLCFWWGNWGSFDAKVEIVLWFCIPGNSWSFVTGYKFHRNQSMKGTEMETLYVLNLINHKLSIFNIFEWLLMLFTCTGVCQSKHKCRVISTTWTSLFVGLRCFVRLAKTHANLYTPTFEDVFNYIVRDCKCWRQPQSETTLLAKIKRSECPCTWWRAPKTMAKCGDNSGSCRRKTSPTSRHICAWPFTLDAENDFAHFTCDFSAHKPNMCAHACFAPLFVLRGARKLLHLRQTAGSSSFNSWCHRNKRIYTHFYHVSSIRRRKGRENRVRLIEK